MAETVKHTKGPWIAASYSSVVGAPVVAASGRPVASVTYFHLGEGFDNHERESTANGRLIAAAPDLLEALKGFIAAFPLPLHKGEREAIEAAKTAIAKAEGQQ